MKSLRSVLSDIPDPVFVAESGSNLICAANEAAFTACESFNPLGEKIGDIIHFESADMSNGPAYFNNQWLNPKQSRFFWNKKTYTKLVLQQPPSIPDEHTLFTTRKMIAVLLHRLRSPMTGMQGYLDLVEHVDSENDKRKLAKVSEGLDYLFQIMDELELLHHADAYVDDEPITICSDAEKIIREMLFDYPTDLRNRFLIRNYSEKEFRFNPSELSQIMTLLINNAAEHPSASDKPINIEIHSPRKITITNFGSPIPDEIVDNLFYPFVTTKANNLGIGLSLAQLLANRRKAIIMLNENSLSRGISFTLLCSPEVKE